jgi:FKBP-type peptidyl-prolyl cis-trans isomerase
MRGNVRSVFEWLILGGALACSSAPQQPAAAPVPSAAEDAKAVMAQELGDAPAPQGPCPERGEPRVLENPRAAVNRTALGLAYCVLQEGPPGQVPGAEDVVKVHYSGWTEEGELFDSSQDKGPVDLPLNAVIRGWSEGLKLMTPGDKARLWIPGNLGYGRRDPGGAAGSPPKGTLIFDVELLSIERSPEKPPAPTAEGEGEAPKPATDDNDESKPRLTPRPVPKGDAEAGMNGKQGGS